MKRIKLSLVTAKEIFAPKAFLRTNNKFIPMFRVQKRIKNNEVKR